MSGYINFNDKRSIQSVGSCSSCLVAAGLGSKRNGFWNIDNNNCSFANRGRLGQIRNHSSIVRNCGCDSGNRNFHFDSGSFSWSANSSNCGCLCTSIGSCCCHCGNRNVHFDNNRSIRSVGRSIGGNSCPSNSLCDCGSWHINLNRGSSSWRGCMGSGEQNTSTSDCRGLSWNWNIHLNNNGSI